MRTRLMLAVLGVVMTAVVASARAEVNVEGQNVNGLPGQRVFLELVYDYGDEFKLIVEELKISFPSDGLTFVKEASTIDLFGQTRTLDQYRTFLGGGALDNVADDFYFLSFQTTTPQVRSGIVRLRAAFDIPAATTPGRYGVSVAGALYDESECCELPTSLQNLSVIVQPNALPIPEPKIALMLLAGLLLVVLYARLRGAGSR